MNINRLRPTGVKKDDLDLWLSSVVNDAIRDANEAGLSWRTIFLLLKNFASMAADAATVPKAAPERQDMSEQTTRLSTREKQELMPLVNEAQNFSRLALESWTAVGKMLDSMESRNHSQCCPVGGMHMAARNGCSGTMPCPCGWDAPESAEDVLRRMIAFVGKRLGNPTDVETQDLLTDALAALNRATALR